MTIQITLRTALLFLLAYSFSFAASIQVSLAKPELVQDRLQKGAVTGKARQAAIRTLFEEAGCTVEEQRVSRKTANVICTLPGTSDSIVVIGGKLSAINPDDYYASYKLAAMYLAYLDGQLGSIAP